MLTWSCELQRSAVNSLWIEKGLCWNSSLCLKYVETGDWKDPLVHWIHCTGKTETLCTVIPFLHSPHPPPTPPPKKKKKKKREKENMLRCFWRKCFNTMQSISMSVFWPSLPLRQFLHQIFSVSCRMTKILKPYGEQRWVIIYFLLLHWKEILFSPQLLIFLYFWRTVSLV